MSLMAKLGGVLVNGTVTPMYPICSIVRNCGCTYDPIGHCYDQWCCDSRTGEICGDTGCIGYSGCPSC